MEVTKCLKPTDSGHDFGDCASVQAATAEGVFRVRDDEPTPRVGATMHRTP